MMKFEYGSLSLQDLNVEVVANPKSGKKTVKSLLVKGEAVRPSKRFWTSLQVYYRFSDNIFNYFDHAEVFQRIASCKPNERMRYCIQRDANGDGTLLAVTGLNKPVIHYDDLMNTLKRYETQKIGYTNGVLSSTHAPTRGGGLFQIQGDVFERRFVMDTPVDGFGRPNIFLSLLRQVCINGAIGYAKAFRTELRVGRGSDDVRYAIVRALDNFGNDEGFAALRQRFESAADSWASVAECNRLYRDLLRLHTAHHLGNSEANKPAVKIGGDGAALSDYSSSKIMNRFHDLTGNLVGLYGVAQIEALSIKRQRTLPARCMVYDLLNYATEVATHHATDLGSKALQAYVGTLVSQEYDMEGTAIQSKDFGDFFLKN